MGVADLDPSASSRGDGSSSEGSVDASFSGSSWLSPSGARVCQCCWWQQEAQWQVCGQELHQGHQNSSILDTFLPLSSFICLLFFDTQPLVSWSCHDIAELISRNQPPITLQRSFQTLLDCVCTPPAGPGWRHSPKFRSVSSLHHELGLANTWPGGVTLQLRMRRTVLCLHVVAPRLAVPCRAVCHGYGYRAILGTARRRHGTVYTSILTVPCRAVPCWARLSFSCKHSIFDNLVTYTAKSIRNFDILSVIWDASQQQMFSTQNSYTYNWLQSHNYYRCGILRSYYSGNQRNYKVCGILHYRFTHPHDNSCRDTSLVCLISWWGNSRSDCSRTN